MFLPVNRPFWFQITGKGFGIIAVGLKVYEMAAEVDINVENFSQVAVGTALVGFSATLVTPVVLLVAVRLFAWELYELQAGAWFVGYGR